MKEEEKKKIQFKKMFTTSIYLMTLSLLFAFLPLERIKFFDKNDIGFVTLSFGCLSILHTYFSLFYSVLYRINVDYFEVIKEAFTFSNLKNR